MGVKKEMFKAFRHLCLWYFEYGGLGGKVDVYGIFFCGICSFVCFVEHFYTSTVGEHTVN